MKRKDWDTRTSIEKRLFDGINRLTKTIKRISLSYETVAEITAAISALTETKEWKAIALSESLKMVRAVASQNAKTWREAASKAGGGRGFKIFQSLRQELAQSETFVSIVRSNAELISRMPDDVARHITEHVGTQTVRGLRAESLIEDIRQFAPQVSESRARLIARTEVAKTNSAITHVRSEKLGIRFYTWQTSQDSRVRSSHRHMQGVICSYNSPPSPEQLKGEPAVGFYGPGEIWNCRCFAAPIINPGSETWPKKVVSNGQIVRISKKQFMDLH